MGRRHSRRHTNTKGLAKIKSEVSKRQLKRISRKLDIPFEDDILKQKREKK